MLYLDVRVIVVSGCVSSTDVFLWGSSWSCTDVVCILLACRYTIACSPCLCSLCLEEILCLVCGGCENAMVFWDIASLSIQLALDTEASNLFSCFEAELSYL
jgi:hypothetical protein